MRMKVMVRLGVLLVAMNGVTHAQALPGDPVLPVLVEAFPMMATLISSTGPSLEDPRDPFGNGTLTIFCRSAAQDEEQMGRTVIFPDTRLVTTADRSFSDLDTGFDGWEGVSQLLRAGSDDGEVLAVDLVQSLTFAAAPDFSSRMNDRVFGNYVRTGLPSFRGELVRTRITTHEPTGESAVCVQIFRFTGGRGQYERAQFPVDRLPIQRLSTRMRMALGFDLPASVRATRVRDRAVLLPGQVQSTTQVDGLALTIPGVSQAEGELTARMQADWAVPDEPLFSVPYRFSGEANAAEISATFNDEPLQIVSGAPLTADNLNVLNLDTSERAGQSGVLQLVLTSRSAQPVELLIIDDLRFQPDQPDNIVVPSGGGGAWSWRSLLGLLVLAIVRICALQLNSRAVRRPVIMCG
jgi:hypothetical protein